MKPQKTYEEERLEEINKAYSKAVNFPTTIIGRKRLRALRKALSELGINVHIPMNSALYTNDYCLKYGNKEPNNGFANSLFSELHK